MKMRAEPAARELAANSTCVLVADGTILQRSGKDRGSDTTHIEAALERFAEDLEGTHADDLLILGEGVDGSLTLYVPAEVATHSSGSGVVHLDDYRKRASQKFSQRVRIHVRVIGEEVVALGATALLMNELGTWILLESVSIAWERSGASITADAV